VLMREAACCMDGLSLHYYVQTRFSENFERSSAVDFDESGWFTFLRLALQMDELLRRHGEIMDRYDPERRVALVVDEWGTWYEVEPGTNPGFLYQQNTMRDALVAATTLDIFNLHSDRVRVANLAQTVNVLQAPILTDGPAIILTPTYHVFDLYKDHQDAHLLPMNISSDLYTIDGESIDAVSGSASRRKDGTIHVTLSNRDPRNKKAINIELRGGAVSHATGRVLTAPEMNSHNTPTSTELVSVQEFDEFMLTGTQITLSLPPMSVVALSVK